MGSVLCGFCYNYVLPLPTLNTICIIIIGCVFKSEHYLTFSTATYVNVSVFNYLMASIYSYQLFEVPSITRTKLDTSGLGLYLLR